VVAVEAFIVLGELSQTEGTDLGIVGMDGGLVALTPFRAIPAIITGAIIAVGIVATEVILFDITLGVVCLVAMGAAGFKNWIITVAVIVGIVAALALLAAEANNLLGSFSSSSGVHLV
jgi:hypothetical protein